MNIITAEQISKLLDSPMAVEAGRILSEGRLWKFRDRLNERDDVGLAGGTGIASGWAGAYVLDGGREPYTVLWNGEDWSCECGAFQACVHLNALLIRLAETRPDDIRLNSSDAGHSEMIPVNEGLLFEDSGLNPAQDLLFFTEPDHVEKKAVLVLGTKAETDTILNQSNLPLVSRSKAPEVTGASFKDLSGTEWCLMPALLTMRSDGTWGPPRPWVPGGPSMPEMSDSSDIGEALKGLLNSDNPPWTTGGERWDFRLAETVRLGFEPLLSAADDDPLYEPLVSFRSGNLILQGGIIAAGDNLLVLDPDNRCSGFKSQTGDFLWFLRLMLSRKVLGASDIRARFAGTRSIPEEIQVELPDLPEALKLLEPVLVLEISGRVGITDFKPRWQYGPVPVYPGSRGDVIMDDGARNGRGRPLGLRNKEKEEELLNETEKLLAGDLSWQRGRYARLTGDPTIPLRLEMTLNDVLAEYAGALIDQGVEIRLEDRPVRKGGGLRINARRKGELLEMNGAVDSEQGASDLDLDEWLEKAGLVRTRDAYFALTGKALTQLKFLRDHGMDESGFLSTSPDNLSLIDAVYAELEATEDTAIDLKRKRSIYQSLISFNPEEFPQPPENFAAELRPYQRHGYAWLLHLREKNLGGCLADDMGLGKTVQTLAYLSRLKVDRLLGRSLMIGPVVTLANWEAEIRRFAPSIRYHRYSGPAGKRVIPGNDDDVDLIIVSYQTLRNDAEKFLDRDWDHIILDEAHYVKNASSRTFKAVRSLRSAHRISLTGTPLENHLNELWSQMSFLNPGLLGSQGQFTQRYVRPVEKDENDTALGRLADTVAPFILRRKKADVLHDLPPKDETVLYCDMTEDQAEAYNAMKELYFRQITGLLSESGKEGSRIEIFTILSKLRLLAIHPPIAGERFKDVSSGKMTALDNLMEEILEEDHKTLVFSQFLGALDRAEETCRSHGWKYSRLTGATKKREDQIDIFNNDPNTRVFLLSLKAGGVGINLTSADYVILLDPWWNPAVEAQAVDRAHRMGQKRPVMAYRLITAGTIEEKVLELQQRKKDLISGVLGDGGVPKLSDDEILKLFE